MEIRKRAAALKKDKSETDKIFYLFDSYFMATNMTSKQDLLRPISRLL